MASLTDAGRAAIEARLAQIKQARAATAAATEALAQELRDHVEAHEAEVAAAKATLEDVLGESEQVAAKIPGIVFAADAKVVQAETWLARNAKHVFALAFGLGALLLVVWAVK